MSSDEHEELKEDLRRIILQLASHKGLNVAETLNSLLNEAVRDVLEAAHLELERRVTIAALEILVRSRPKPPHSKK